MSLSQISTPEFRVLHVDDEEVQLSFTKRFLEELDGEIQVFSAKDSREVLSRLVSESFDCVVSDYQMPVMDGIELARRIRDTSDVPIIIYTGRGSEEVAERAFEVGIDDYIRKEIDPSHYQVLARRIRVAIEKHRGESSSRYVMKILTTISSINQYLLKERGVSEETILSNISDLMVDSGAYMHAHILRTDGHGRVTASYTDHQNDEFTDFFGGLQEGNLPACVSRSIDSEGIHITLDTGPECGDCPLRDKVHEPSVITTRLSIGEELYGALTVLAPAERVGNEEQSLFLELAGDLSHALRQREMEKLLRESEERYRLLVEGTMDYGIFLLDTEGLVSSWNKGVENNKGYSADEIIGKHYSVFYSDDDVESGVPEQQLKDARETGRYENEGWRLRKDGSRFWAHIVISAVYDDSGELYGFSNVTRDITERKQMLEEIRSLARFPSENNNPVMRISGDGIIMYANDASESLLNEWNMEIGAVVSEEWRQIISEVLSEGVGKEVALVHKDRVISFFITPITDTGYVNIYGRDITERKKAEEELLETTHHLEDIVEARTQELFAAEQMTTAGRIAAMVAHDLRGPLQTITNSVYLIKMAPEKVESVLPLITGALDRANNLIEEFRHRTRDSPYQPVMTDLKTVINETLTGQLISHNVTVKKKLRGGPKNVYIDPQKIRRVLDNLIMNAVEAMPDGGEIVIKTQEVRDGVTLKVSDTGVGIPEERLDSIFRPFTSTKPQGIGLGLAYCKRAVEAHGGTITVESRLGEGSTFTIWIPNDSKE